MFRKRGIKLQLLISVLLLFVIASTAMIDWYISMKSYEKTLSEHHLNSNYNYVQKLRTTATHQLNYMSRNVTAIGKDIGKHTYTQEDLDEWFEANSGHFNSLFITDETGSIELVSPARGTLNDEVILKQGVKLESETIQKALRKRETFISEPDYSLSGEFITLITAPIFDNETGKFKGIVGGTIHLESDNVLKCILGNHQYEDQSYVFVVDSNGKLIYHPEEERLGEDVTDNEVVQKVLAKQNGSQKVINSRNKEFFASYAYLKVADWGIVVQTPTEIIQQPLKNLFWRIATLTVPFLIVILLISSFIVSRITKPLNRLAAFTERSLEGAEAASDFKELKINTFVYEVRQLYKQVVKHVSMLSKEVAIDGLTKIFNRRKFNLIIERLFEKETQFSLILLDIDFFKKVNDTYGHIVGDEVLYYLAQTMERVVGKEHLCFRYGGEEFAVILKQTSEEEAYEIAERLRKIVAKTKSPTGEPINISLGVTERKKTDKTVQQVIEKADIALYESKQTGRNKTTLYKENNKSQQHTTNE
ncbi:MAG TPA: diguanylate cyclase [Pseudogracilibacillus sp.]|nr:diguanylate cyclase [Pseudogracilibacillus sp.]